MSEISIDLSGGAASPDAAPAPGVAEVPLLDLPAGAEAQPDGSVVLTLEYPVTVAFRGAEDKARIVTSLTLRRLSGADVRRMTEASAKRAMPMALAASAGETPARMALLTGLMDASDVNAASAVVSALLDIGDDLPERAREDGRTVVLPLLFPVPDREEIVFRRLTGADLLAIGGAKDVVCQALARSAGMSPAEARELFDALDGADAMGVQRVIGFLSGTGRTTGR